MDWFCGIFFQNNQIFQTILLVSKILKLFINLPNRVPGLNFALWNRVKRSQVSYLRVKHLSSYTNPTPEHNYEARSKHSNPKSFVATRSQPLLFELPWPLGCNEGPRQRWRRLQQWWWSNLNLFSLNFHGLWVWVYWFGLENERRRKCRNGWN